MSRMLRLSAWVAFFSVACASVPAGAQSFPTRPVRLVVPFAAGGSIDSIARLIGPKYSAAFGQPVLVDNKPGAASNIGAEFVAKAPPDGHTLLLTSTGLAIGGAVYKNLNYDPEKDLVPVGSLMTTSFVLVVPPAVPARSARELIALMKDSPGKLNFGTTGIGSGNHIAVEMLLQAAGVRAVHIPYKGDAPLFPALLANEVQFAFAPSQLAVPHIRAGRVRALAVAPAKRLTALPDVPTLAEAGGIADYEYSGWIGLFATAGTPRDVLLRIWDETAKILNMPEVNRNYEGWGAEPFALGVDEFGARYRKDVARFRNVVKQANIKVE
jgi:tripartite-type tricarboxylate transporter receptor subunit TctC